MMDWKRLISAKRFGMEELHEERQENRSGFQRNYSRLVFSAPLRRLQNRTQAFPLPGSIFVHSRLTHSPEVPCVERSLGNDVLKAILTRQPQLQDSFLPKIDSIISTACLAHDLGNPPFGHSGEKATSTFFLEGKGARLQDQLLPMEQDDLIYFEGNTNAFRLLIYQFGGRWKGGFVLTYSTLAPTVEYSLPSNLTGNKPRFSLFTTEGEGFHRIATELELIQISDQPLKYVCHPLAYLVEVADDICYQMMDIEDAHRLEILTAKKIKELLPVYLAEKHQSRTRRTSNIVDDANEQITYLRSSVTGLLIEECTRVSLDNETEILSGIFEGPLIKRVSERPEKACKHCSEVSFRKVYRSRDVPDIELVGSRVINMLLEPMIDAVTSPEKAYSQLLINHVSGQHNIKASALYERIQAVLDYVSGMIDVFALDLYHKINGNSLPAV